MRWIEAEDAPTRQTRETEAVDDAKVPHRIGANPRTPEGRICNYCKKPRHIKVECRPLTLNNEKAQRAEQRPNPIEERNFCRSISTTDDTT